MYCCSAYCIVWRPSNGEVLEQFGWNGESGKPFACTLTDDGEDGGEFEEVTFDHNRIWEYRTVAVRVHHRDLRYTVDLLSLMRRPCGFWFLEASGPVAQWVSESVVHWVSGVSGVSGSVSKITL